MIKICVCQIIKDEQRYIQEWIDFYINLGICKFTNKELIEYLNNK